MAGEAVKLAQDDLTIPVLQERLAEARRNEQAYAVLCTRAERERDEAVKRREVVEGHLEDAMERIRELEGRLAMSRQAAASSACGDPECSHPACVGRSS